MELEPNRQPFGFNLAPDQWANIVNQFQDIPGARGADQEDEVFHDPVNAADPKPDLLTVPECTLPTFDPGGISRLSIPF